MKNVVSEKQKPKVLKSTMVQKTTGRLRNIKAIDSLLLWWMNVLST